VTLLVDGEPVFSGASAFRARDDEFMGIMGLHDTVYLDLEKGQHELLFAVAEAFGGWGVMARFRDVSGPVRLHPTVHGAWAHSDGWKMPESVAIDAGRGVAYVTNMNPGPQGFGETGFVTRLSLDGTVDTLEWASGLRGPTGIVVHGGRVLVVERTGLAEIDAATGEILKRHELAGAFLNDVAVASDGTIYVSDSRAGAVLRYADNRWGRWLAGPELAGANGVAVAGSTLIVGASATGQVLTLDRATGDLLRRVDLAPCFLDGVVAGSDGAVLVTDYTGRLLEIDSTGAVTTLVDRQETGVGCADFAWSPERGLVIVPSLRSHTVEAFQIAEPAP
jgi:DNA-binding beta-propeller fold protein YncE